MQDNKNLAKAIPYPTFPRWVVDGTSIGEGLVKPVCRVNSRYPEYMFMPAVALMLNFLGTKVRIEDKPFNPSFYMVSIGRMGQVIKTSCVLDAIEYFENIQVAGDGSRTKNANGRSLVWAPISPESIGREMSRTSCRNTVLFYESLPLLIKKMKLQTMFKPALLKLYESGTYANYVGSKKQSFKLDRNSYCTSLIAVATEKEFHLSSSMLDDLKDRMFFLYQPEKLEPCKPYMYVSTVEGSLRTRQLIDAALRQGVYKFTPETKELLEMTIDRFGNRVEQRVEKLALYFAVDLGKDEIDESCVERAVAIARYEVQVKKYLKTFHVFHTANKDDELQNEIIGALIRSGGLMTARELDRAVHPERYGTFMWNHSYGNLIKDGWIAEIGNGSKQTPKQIVLMRLPDDAIELPRAA